MKNSHTVLLKPSKTYQLRKVLWSRMTRDGFPCCGVMQVDESARVTGTKVYTRRYAVLEQKTDDGGRLFQLTKPLGLGQERYFVFMSAAGTDDRCDCRGHDRHGTCVHMQAVRELMVRGFIPPATEPRPVSGPV